MRGGIVDDIILFRESFREATVIRYSFKSEAITRVHFQSFSFLISCLVDFCTSSFIFLGMCCIFLCECVFASRGSRPKHSRSRLFFLVLLPFCALVYTKLVSPFFSAQAAGAPLSLCWFPWAWTPSGRLFVWLFCYAALDMLFFISLISLFL